MGGTHKKCHCGLIASFGFDKISGTKFCSKHKEDGMVNLLCKSCECGRARPTYNYEGLSAKYCVQCKEDGMINVNDKRCICKKATPSFNFKGLKAEYCGSCRLDGMINVIDKSCECGKSSKPCFNYPGLKPRFCSQCKEEGMIDIFRKMCKCGKVQPSFNYKGLQPEYCSKCKLDDMIITRKRRCIQCKNKQATYNLYGKKAEYCNTCKTDEMINVMDKCKNDNCTRSGNIKYDYYCTFCFQHLFPNDERVKNVRMKTKENYVRDYLKDNFDGFIHDVPLWTSACDCTHKRRIDFRKLIGNTLLCIEVDEDQHKRYSESDEEIRYDDLYMVFSGKFIFIRINPDKYINEYGTKVNPTMKKRMELLRDEINIHIERINNEENSDLLEIHKLCFDGFKNLY